MSFLNKAAFYYKEEAHQVEAWDYLESCVSPEVLSKFQDLYRNAKTEYTTPPVSEDGPITKDTFAEITGHAAHLFTDTEVNDCNRLLIETGFISYPDATCMLLANIMHETGGMRWMSELSDGWAYEGRSDLGNTQSGDGPRFKGAGVLQLTGRYNYSRLHQALGDARIMEGCEYVSKTYPFMSARTWIEENHLLEIAQTQGFDSVCRRINGGWNGYEDRLHYYQICKEVLL